MKRLSAFLGAVLLSIGAASAQPDPNTVTPVHLYLDVTATPGAQKGDLFYSNNTSGFIKHLRIGSVGDCLKVSASFLPSWSASCGGGGGSSPLTTKGDLWGFDTADNRVPVGANDTFLVGDSSAALGVSYRLLLAADIPAIPESGVTGLVADLAAKVDLQASTPGSAQTGHVNVTGTIIAGGFTGPLTGNADTATALAANGTNCSAGQFPLGVDASGNSESCTALPTSIAGTANQIAASASTGAVTLSIPTNPTLPGTTTGTFSGNLTGNVTGNASTATALAANGGNCSSGQFAQGVDASGAAEGCTALPTTISGTANQITASAATGAVTLSIPTNPTLPGTTTGTFSGNLTGNVTGNADTATALAANGTNCTSGHYPLGVDASGNAEGCTAAATGTVTSIATTSPITGGTITSTGTIGISITTTNDGGAVVKQSSTPGTQQTGNLNISGDGIFGNNVGIGQNSTSTDRLAITDTTNGSHQIFITGSATGVNNGPKLGLANAAQEWNEGLGYGAASGNWVLKDITGSKNRIEVDTSGNLFTTGTYIQQATGVTTSPRGVVSQQSNGGGQGARFLMRKSRGSVGSESVVTTGDNLGALDVQAWDGSAWNPAAQLNVAVTGTVATGQTAGMFQFLTAPAGTLTERFRIDANGNLVCGAGAVSTSATDGFIYFPTCAGTPSGTPTTYTGLTPFLIDSTNTRLYAYLGGAWKSLTLTTTGAGGNYTYSNAVGSEPAANSGDLNLPPGQPDLAIERYSGSAWQSWGPLVQFTDPTTPSWAWLNQGSATVTTIGQSIELNSGNATNGYNIRGREIAVPTAPYTRTAIFQASIPPWPTGAAAYGYGIYLRDSVSAKLVIFTMPHDASNTAAGGHLYGFAFTNPTTYAGTQYFTMTTPSARDWVNGGPIMMQIKDDNTTRYFNISGDGRNWVTLFSHGRTTFITPDKIGFFVYANSTSATTPTIVRLLSWQ